MPWKEVSIMSQRLEFVTLATAENANIRHLCRSFNISPATAYKWLDRFQSDGANGLRYLTSLSIVLPSLICVICGSYIRD